MALSANLPSPNKKGKICSSLLGIHTKNYGPLHQSFFFQVYTLSYISPSILSFAWSLFKQLECWKIGLLSTPCNGYFTPEFKSIFFYSPPPVSVVAIACDPFLHPTGGLHHTIFHFYLNEVLEATIFIAGVGFLI